MVFGLPPALFWLALAVPILALYLVKVRLRRVHVSTNLFWQQIYEEKSPRSFWQHLRYLFSLLLQLLLLLLLVLAVADPSLPWQRDRARRIVLVVDFSASMQANDIQPTRFAAAIDAAHALIDGLRSADEMAIVLAGNRPEVKIGMNSHVPTLRRALSDLVPEDVPGKLKPAVELAQRLVGKSSGGQIIVLTDCCTDEVLTNDASSDFSTEPEKEVGVEYRLIGSNAANIGLTQFQVRRSHADPLGYEVLVQVHNSSTAAVQCRLELELEGLPVDILPLTLAPGEFWSRSVDKTSRAGGQLSGRLTEIAAAEELSGDISVSDSTSLNGLALDDTAWAVLRNREVQKVLLVTPGNLFLEKVFEANPLVDIEVVQEIPASWPLDTFIVLHQLVPDTIPAGDVLIVDPNRSTDLWTLGEPLVDPLITESDTNSSLMTHVHLDNVLISEAHQIKATGAHRVLAGTVSGDMVYAELMHEDGRCLILSTNLEESDLAFRTVFPIMISNALGWFAEAREERADNSVSANGGLLDVRESDLRPVEGLSRSQSRQLPVTGWFTRPLWFYLAAVACVLTVSEWFLYQRRFTD